MELDIMKLREQRRPLWMSYIGIDNYADMLGGGGDIWLDRVALEWARHTGEELTDDEAIELGFEGAESGLYESAPAEAAASLSSSQQETVSSQQETSPGINVGADINVEVSGVGETVKEVTGVVSETVSKTSKTLGNILGGVTKKVKDASK